MDLKDHLSQYLQSAGSATPPIVESPTLEAAHAPPSRAPVTSPTRTQKSPAKTKEFRSFSPARPFEPPPAPPAPPTERHDVSKPEENFTPTPTTTSTSTPADTLQYEGLLQVNAELKDALRGILESQRTSDRRDIETVDLEAENLAKRQQLAEVELAHLRQQVVLRQGELARITSRTAELREEVRLGEARRPTVSAELGSLESTLERANQDLGVGEEGRGDTMATLQEEVARLRVHKENVTDQVDAVRSKCVNAAEMLRVITPVAHLEGYNTHPTTPLPFIPNLAPALRDFLQASEVDATQPSDVDASTVTLEELGNLRSSVVDSMPLQHYELLRRVHQLYAEKLESVGSHQHHHHHHHHEHHHDHQYPLPQRDQHQHQHQHQPQHQRSEQYNHHQHHHHHQKQHYQPHNIQYPPPQHDQQHDHHHHHHHHHHEQYLPPAPATPQLQSVHAAHPSSAPPHLQAAPAVPVADHHHHHHHHHFHPQAPSVQDHAFSEVRTVTPQRGQHQHQEHLAHHATPQQEAVSVRSPLSVENVVTPAVIAEVSLYQYEMLHVENAGFTAPSTADVCCRLDNTRSAVMFFVKVPVGPLQSSTCSIEYRDIRSVEMVAHDPGAQSSSNAVVLRCDNAQTIFVRQLEGVGAGLLEGLYRMLRVVLFNDVSFPLSLLKCCTLVQFDALTVVHPGVHPKPIACRLRLEKNFIVLTQSDTQQLPRELKEVAIKWAKITGATAAAGTQALSLHTSSQKAHHSPVLFPRNPSQMEALSAVLALFTTVTAE